MNVEGVYLVSRHGHETLIKPVESTSTDLAEDRRRKRRALDLVAEQFRVAISSGCRVRLYDRHGRIVEEVE